MASDVVAIEQLEERPMAVEPRAIESEFTRIWLETAGNGSDRSSIRLRTLNFVALANDATAEAKFGEAMELLVERHPCRGILAIISSQYERLEASISARCWRTPGGSRHVCSEEVLLTGAADQEQEVESAVLALLVPELPVSVWLMGSPDIARLLDTEIIAAANRLFFDSANAVDRAQAYRDIGRAGRESDVELVDLSWARLAAWRALCAQFFDGPDGMRQLSQIASIEILHGGASRGGEALLLAGWLVSRLDLFIADVTQSADGVQATFYQRSRGVNVSIGTDGSQSSAIRQVRIRTLEAEFSAELHPESMHLHVSERWAADVARRTVESVPIDDASVIAAALDDYVDPKIYVQALTAATSLLGDYAFTGSGR
jgi:glucose-6-phosphate dehydrogenase assembly protein OpcA